MDANISEIYTPADPNGSVEEINPITNISKTDDDTSSTETNTVVETSREPYTNDQITVSCIETISPVPTSTSDTCIAVEYESATQVYENSSNEESLLKECDDSENAVVIVTTSEQHPNNNDVIYENVNFFEACSASTENIEGAMVEKLNETDLLAEELNQEHVVSITYNEDIIGHEIVYQAREAVETLQNVKHGMGDLTIRREINDEGQITECVRDEHIENLEGDDCVNENVEDVTHENVEDVTNENVENENVLLEIEHQQISDVVYNTEQISDNADNETRTDCVITSQELNANSNVVTDVKVDINNANIVANSNLEIDTMEDLKQEVIKTDVQFKQAQTNEDENNSYENVEQQLSELIRQSSYESEDTCKKSMSIVEAISRDFDDDDSDAEKVIEEVSKENVEDVSNTNTEAEQVYIVEEVDNVLVLEDGSIHQQHDDPIEVTIIENDFQDMELQSPEKPTPKPVKKTNRQTQRLPSHVLGRNITNPSNDKFRNGKVPPKPRLGVKIPYRNLTSQIVSKDEIAKEILDRQRLKYDQMNVKPGESFFAKKLTQRLAKRIAPLKHTKTPTKQTETVTKTTTEKIDNSDLLAILEGDGDENDCRKNVSDSKMSGKNSEEAKLLEKEIALKQLMELPRGRGRGRRICNIPSMNKQMGKIVETKRINSEAITNLKTGEKIETIPSNIKKGSINDKITDVKGAEINTDVNTTTDVQPNTVNIVEEKLKPETAPKPEVELKPETKLKPESKLKPETKTKLESKPELETKLKPETKPTLEIKSKLETNPTETKITNKTSELNTKSKSNQPSSDPQNTNVRDEYPLRKLSTSIPVKTYTRKRKLSDDLSPVTDKKIPINQSKDDTKDIPLQRGYITKSSRVIKRKVIWDPDEPSTTRSVSLKSPKPTDIANKVEKAHTKLTEKKLVKSKIEAPKAGNKKRLSEVDKLLMDEGAVNLLHALKKTEDAPKKKKATVISLDKAQKELMNKTNEIKKELRSSSDKISPKSLRKKENPIGVPVKKSITPASVTRKKSKDSNRSSLHSPPASPGLIYLHHAEASRIIRRHSSSSYSSDDGNIEDKQEEKTEDSKIQVEPDKVTKRKSAPSSLDTTKVKKLKRSVDKEKLTIVTDKNKDSQENSKNFNKLVEVDGKSLHKYNQYKTFSVKVIEHLIQIVLLPSINNQVYLTPEILQELCNILKEIEEDKNCNVVVVNSSAMSFCNGINYKSLLHEKEQARKTFAKKLATSVSNFLKVLAAFPKILVAGVHGDTTGLGVTMLPLFDMVIASDTATFSVQNARLGCPAEGGSLLSLPHLMHNVLVSELLYSSRKLIAAEALRLGMVTRILWPDKFQQELLSVVKIISNHSSKFMQLTKKQLRERMLENVDSLMNKEVTTLVEHWIGTECQRNFGVYG